MARQSPGRRNTEEQAPENVNDVDDSLDEDPADSADDDGDEALQESDSPIWAESKISAVEIALPAGSGYTLRAYRSSSTLTPTDVADRVEDDPFAARAARQAAAEEEVFGDEELADDDTLAEIGRHRGQLDSDDLPYAADTVEDELLEDEDEDDDEEEALEEEPPDEEVPVFLSHRGRLLLFRSAESLVAFVRSGAPNDLSQVEGWAELAERLEPADVAPGEDDTYELDLVVENLRGGHDAWDLELIIKAGEAARDVGYALRLEPVLTALSSGSPLDDLDDALRSAVDGGVGGFFARRRLRKIGAQQATLGWRTIIGKISGAVDWRD